MQEIPHQVITDYEIPYSPEQRLRMRTIDMRSHAFSASNLWFISFRVPRLQG